MVQWQTQRIQNAPRKHRGSIPLIGTRQERRFGMDKPSITRIFGFRGYLKDYFFDLNYWKVNEWYCQRFRDACLIAKDIQEGTDIEKKYRGIAYKDAVISVTV